MAGGKLDADRVYSPEQFIVEAPLYAIIKTDGLYAPGKIEAHCSGCGKETTWDRTAGPETITERESDGSVIVPDHNLKFTAYKCHRCGSGPFVIIYREVSHGTRELPPRPPIGAIRNPGPPPKPQRIVISAMKIGQYPAPSIAAPKGMEKALGPELIVFYRKALMNWNFGNGIAAVAYMRRIVEDSTNELIEIAAAEAESRGEPAEVVAGMRAALNTEKYTSYEIKLKVAASVFPDSLKVGGHNPLEVLFGAVSKGLHSLSEDECIQVADRIRLVFEYVFENLKAQTDKRRAYEASFKGLL